MSLGALCYVLTLDVRRIYYSLDMFAGHVVWMRVIPVGLLRKNGLASRITVKPASPKILLPFFPLGRVSMHLLQVSPGGLSS